MVKYWIQIMVLGGLLALAGCGGSEAAAPGDTTTDGAEDTIQWPDGTIEPDGTEPTACETDQECLTLKGGAPACQTWTCQATAGCVLKPLDNGADCNDGNACTANEKCLNGTCLGDGVSCDDGNACTDDTCDAETGCAHANNTKACNDANLCTLNDHCQAGACTGDADPKCQCAADADCGAFDDGNKCNGHLVCLGSQCVVDAATVVDCSTVAVGACETVACDPTSGECTTAFKANGTECSDGDFCTLNDACQGGQCKGSVRDCDDDNACTDDTCDKLSGCVYLANTKACDDGNLCTTGDACAASACKGTPNPECQCTGDADCKPFDDGDLCNGTMMCKDGACAVNPATVVTCDAGLGGPCKVVFCEAQTGQCRAKNELDGAACDDSNKCTANDVCASGACVGAGVSCDDANLCTTDSCTPATGCAHANNTLACDDGNACTSGDVCAAGACTGTAEPGACSCTVDADCAGQEDGDKCNGTLACVDGACVADPATVVTCPAAAGCTQFACEKETGECVEAQAADGTLCEDTDACTQGSTCLAGACKGGAPVICDDTNLCTDDHCDPVVGCQYGYNTESCDDGNPCTASDACKEGVCTGNPTTECVCATDGDCDVFDDGNKCNGTLACVENKCVVKVDSQIVCEPAPVDGCKLSYCEPETGTCVTPDLPDGKPCDDADACTLVDVCKAGACQGSGALACADLNPCTDDTCDPASGCVFAYNQAPCDDNDPCTSGDACNVGMCQPGDDVCGDTCVADWTLTCGGSDSWSTLLGGTTNVVDAYACNAEDSYTGPEYTYRFQAPYAGTVTVYLTDETDETDVIAIDSQGQGCHSNNCRAWGYSTVTLTMTEGAQFFFVVDGYEGASGDYTITVQCTPETELVCDDGLDDDADGLIDCADEADCLGTEACPVPHCQPDWPLTCGDSDSWWNYGSGSTDLVDAYTCTEWDQSGPEYTYTFTSPIDGDVTIALADVSADLDLMVLTAGTEGECLPAACVAAGDEAGDDSVTFTAVAGTTYYIVVDGYNGNEGSYTITASCGEAPIETVCDDQIDDDNDGATDCDDSDCLFASACLAGACVPAEAIGCGDLLQGNTLAFGSTEAVDSYGCNAGEVYDGPEYAYTFVAPYSGVALALLEDDDPNVDVLIVKATGDLCDPANACVAWDYEGLTFDLEEGATYYVIVDGVEGTSAAYSLALECQALTEQSCVDGFDDDADGLTDCLDPDCASSAFCPACTPVETVACGDVVYGANDAVGSTWAIESYLGCDNSYLYTGPEIALTFTAEVSGLVEVALTDETAETDVIVLAGDACNPSACLAYGLGSALFEATAGQTYQVVVDGFGLDIPGAVGDFTLTVTCE